MDLTSGRSTARDNLRVPEVISTTMRVVGHNSEISTEVAVWGKRAGKRPRRTPAGTGDCSSSRPLISYLKFTLIALVEAC